MSHAWFISCFICIVLLDAVGCSQADQDNVIVRPDAEGPRGMIRQAGPWLVRHPDPELNFMVCVLSMLRQVYFKQQS